MAVTDVDQLEEIAWRVLDDTDFLSGLWTRSEVAGYFNQRQNRFNKMANLVLAHLPIAVGSDVAVSDLPQDWIASLRATWKQAGFMVPLGRSDRYSASLGIQTWNAPTTPTLYDDHGPGPLKIQLMPPPNGDGVLELLYACVLETLPFDDEAPEIFDLPDDVVPYVTYGVLADMFAKDGRGRDLARAAYCESRFEEGLLIVSVLIGGYA